MRETALKNLDNLAFRNLFGVRALPLSVKRADADLSSLVDRCSERDMDERIASLTATSDTVELYQKVIGWLEVDHGQAGGISILCQVRARSQLAGCVPGP